MTIKRSYVAEVVGLLQSEGSRFFLQGFCKEYSKEEVFNIYLSSLEWVDVLDNVALYSKVKVTKVENGDFYLDKVLYNARFTHSDYHIHRALERFRKCYLAVEQDNSFTGMSNTGIAIIASAVLLSSQQSLRGEMRR